MTTSATFCRASRTIDEYEAHVKLARAERRFPVDPKTVAETLIYMRYLPHCRPAAENLALMGLSENIGRPVEALDNREKGALVEALATDQRFAKAVAYVLKGVA